MADGGMAGGAVDAVAVAEAQRVSKRAVEIRAIKEGWPYESRAARGGQKRFYSVGLLPTDVRDALQRHRAIASAASDQLAQRTPAFEQGQRLARRITIVDQVTATAQQREFELGAVAAVGLSGKCRERMQAKLDLIARLGTFAKARAIGVCAAMVEFCDAYNSGALTVPLTVRMHTGANLHPATLRRWKRDLKARGPAALAGDYGNRAKTGVIDTNADLRDFAIGLVIDKPHIDGTALHTAIETRFKGAKLPSERTTQRWLTQWKKDNAEALLSVANPDAWKNKYKVAFGNLDDGIVRANQLWQLDSTPGDIQLVDGRYNIIGAIDIATRRLKLHVAKTSTAEAVCSLIRRAILDWGVPEAVKIDNGADYASKRVERALQGLQIEPNFSQPFSPWEKGNIERAFRTFSHGILELLSGFIGHNVAEAQALRAGESFADRMFKKNTITTIKLTAAELQDFCDDWCDVLYAHAAHDGLKGETPFQRAASLRHPVRRIGNVRALDLLLAEAPDGNGMRTVSKKGIKLDRTWYIAPELHALVRQPVQVLYDQADAGRVVVYHQGEFVCIAESPELLGVSRQEIAIEGRIQQNAAVKETRRAFKALKRKANTTDIAWEILARKREEAAQLAAFPAPNVLHLTPNLEAAAEAAEALDTSRAPTTPAEPITIAHLANLRDVMRGEQAQNETAEDRFRRALRALMKPEGERDDLERRFLQNHTQSSEFRARWGMFEEWGPSAFHLSDDFAALLPDGPAFDRLARAQQGDF